MVGRTPASGNKGSPLNQLGPGAPAPQRKSPDQAAERLGIPWRHPQAWVPKEISFYFFLMPFIFWPMALIWGVLHVYSQDLAHVPLYALKDYQQPTISQVYAADRTLLAELYREHRLLISLEKFPQTVIEAFLAAEDSSFYQHQGVDFVGLIRAAIANFQAGRAVQGGSTITQQMVRTFLLTNEKTIDRKLKEMILSWRVERILTKDEILGLYLNRIYLGRGAYGVESAARLYFGKGIREVNLAEAAMLAGLAKAPGRMAAHLRTEASKERQRYVIARMLAVGFISEPEARRALTTPLNFIQTRPNLYREIAPQFTEVVRRQAVNFLGEEELLTNGYRIYTTLDLKAQAWAEEAVKNGLDAVAKRQKFSPVISRLTRAQAAAYREKTSQFLASRPLLPGQEQAALVTDVDVETLDLIFGDEKIFITAENLKWFTGNKKLSDRFAPDDLIMTRLVTQNQETGVWEGLPAPPPDLQGALVLMENQTGKVRALVGGRDFDQTQFNRATQARRQPGSSFKPFVYAAALDHGYTEASIIYDVPTQYQDGPNIWTPKNYSGKHSGPMTLYDALLSSVNVVAVKVCDQVGPAVVAEYARRMGIGSPLVAALSLALGASEVTLLELTTAYTTFPNLGTWVWPLFIDRIEDRYGRTVQEFTPYLTEALSPQTAYIVLDMLTGVATRGTAARVGRALDIPVGGKTGTTNSHADALFIGFTPKYTCGVWVGRDVRISLGPGEQGGRTAAPIFTEFMQNFMADKETGEFQMPEGVVRRTLQAETQDGRNSGGRAFVFKVGEIGRGLIDQTMPIAEAAPPDTPNFATMSQEELDRRLQEYLTDYERRRANQL